MSEVLKVTDKRASFPGREDMIAPLSPAPLHKSPSYKVIDRRSSALPDVEVRPKGEPIKDIISRRGGHRIPIYRGVGFSLEVDNSYFDCGLLVLVRKSEGGSSSRVKRILFGQVDSSISDSLLSIIPEDADASDFISSENPYLGLDGHEYISLEALWNADKIWLREHPEDMHPNTERGEPFQVLSIVDHILASRS